MKILLVPIDKAGRVVLPKSVRDELAINPGDMLKVSIHGNEVTLRPEKESAGFVRKGRALVFSTGGSGPLRLETVETILDEERERSTTRAIQGLPERRKNP